MKTYLLILCLIPLFLSAAEPTGRISGTVKDAETGEALPGANITLGGTVMGDASGRSGDFIIKNVPVGIYNVRAVMMGYRQDTVNVRVQLSQTAQIEFELDPVILDTPELEVTANKRRQSIQDTPASIGLMTRRDVQRFNDIFADELLQHASGVNFIGSQINIRGSSGFNYGAGSRVLLLVDGVPVMPGDSGDLKWNLIPTTQIERIEIIKGAGSALYGSSALGGVVNIITKNISPQPVLHARLSAGAYDQPRYELWQWSDKIRMFSNIDIDYSRQINERLSVFAAAGRHESMGYSQNSEYLRHNASLKLHSKWSSNQNATLSLSWEGGRRQDGLMWQSQRHALEVDPDALEDYVDSNKLSANLFHRWVLRRNIALKSRLSYFRNYWKNVFHDNRTSSTAQKFGAEIQAEVQISDEHALILGAEESLDHVQSGLVGNHDQYTLSGYIQNEQNLFTTVSITAGVRYDYHNVDTGFQDSEWSPKLGLVWHVQPALTLRTSSGRGFRTASMSERFSDSVYSGLRITPNPDLKSETSWSHDLGLNWRPTEFIYLDLSAFWSDYWDLIEPEPNENQVIQFINVTRARITGVESMIKILPHRTVFLDFSHTFMEPRDLDLKDVLAYRPRHIFSIAANWRIHDFEFAADYKFVSRFEKVKVYPVDQRVPQKVLNTRIRWHLDPVAVALDINNAFNYNYVQMERNLEPIRHYVLTLSGTF